MKIRLYFDAFWSADPALGFAEALGFGFLRKPWNPRKPMVFLRFSTKITKNLRFPNVSPWKSLKKTTGFQRFSEGLGLPAHALYPRPANPLKVQISCLDQKFAPNVKISLYFDAFWSADPALSFSDSLGFGFRLPRKPKNPWKPLVFLRFFIENYEKPQLY